MVSKGPVEVGGVPSSKKSLKAKKDSIDSDAIILSQQIPSQQQILEQQN